MKTVLGQLYRVTSFADAPQQVVRDVFLTKMFISGSSLVILYYNRSKNTEMHSGRAIMISLWTPRIESIQLHHALPSWSAFRKK